MCVKGPGSVEDDFFCHALRYISHIQRLRVQVGVVESVVAIFGELLVVVDSESSAFGELAAAVEPESPEFGESVAVVN